MSSKRLSVEHVQIHSVNDEESLATDIRNGIDAVYHIAERFLDDTRYLGGYESDIENCRVTWAQIRGVCALPPAFPFLDLADEKQLHHV